MTKIVCVSDTHRFHYQITTPECDILIFAGDAGLEDIDSKMGTYRLRDFLNWMYEQPAKAKIFCAGNHDWYAYHYPKIIHKLSEEYGVVYLDNEGVEINGLKIWASPWSLRFCDWAFNLNRDEELLRKFWSQIPNDSDIIITHGPPYGILDSINPQKPEPLGDKVLLERIKEVKPTCSIFGHLHGGYGIVEQDGITYINASVCTEEYKPTNRVTEYTI